MKNTSATAYVTAVIGDTLTIALNDDAQGGLIKNEVVYVVPSRKQTEGADEKLMAEVLRIRGKSADIQVYEDTRGIAVGDPVLQTGRLLTLDLGPGILSQVYDGLQQPLERLAQVHGQFLKRGVKVDALDLEKKWPFTAVATKGDMLRAGQTFGTVPEGRFSHQVMVPFDLMGELELVYIEDGDFTADTVVAKVKDARGKVHDLTMIQKWPVRRSIAEGLSGEGRTARLYPSEPLVTTQRTIDTFFPIARGGTGCIPGPFGSGKTVLQHSISRYCDADMVIVVACGERAGEVVETIEEFPRLSDPRHGGSLIERTVIICNTSSMPVAAREASIYTGLTIGEYYRQMGYNVLVLADSTSRWAQAMRETSNRLEEIPGEEGFPAYLDSSIKGVYERCGVIENEDGKEGSLTMIGTVSPAGGNFEEPVTQSTLATVKNFLGLSYDRAYKRFYPAIDPLISWSRYLEQLEGWYKENIDPDWVPTVKEMHDLLKNGDSIGKMMQVTGEEGISIEDFVTYQKALFLDMVYLQQNAFDEVDASCSFERQHKVFNIVVTIIREPYGFDSKADARKFFTGMTRYFKNQHFATETSAEYTDYAHKISDLFKEAAGRDLPDDL